MPKQSKKSKPLDLRTLFLSKPLTSTNFGNMSEIDAYLEASGKWETIATVHSVAGMDAEDIATFLISAVSAYVEAQTITHKISSNAK